MAVLCSIRISGSCKMPEAVDHIVHAILASPAPVLLPDTSSLLNIVEAPVPEEGVSPNVVPAALAMLGRLQTTPPSLHVVLAQVVEEEWLRLHASKQDKVVTLIRKADERISRLWGIASAMNSAPAAPYIQFSGLQLCQRLHNAVEVIVGAGRVIGNSEEFQSAAGIRIGAGNAPASSGRPEYEDCLLVEQYLALCRRLRAGGFTQRCIFITSNVRDFGEPRAPRPPLDQEFASAKMDFVYDLAAAGGLI
jgi:hypothetical protein